MVLGVTATNGCLSLAKKLHKTFARGPKAFCRYRHILSEGRQLPASSEEASDFLQISISGQELKVHETWLRHHCKCSDCFTRDTNERKVVPNGSWLTSKVLNVSALEHRNELRLEWTDGHQSQFDLSLLRNSLSSMPPDSWKSTSGIQSPVSVNFTTSSDPLNGAVVPYREFMEGDRGLSRMLSSLLATGFGVVSNVDGLEETKSAHDRISHPIRTIYGEGVTVMVPDLEHNDAAYSTAPLSLHTDTTYFTEPMGLQSLHVLARSGTGGQTCLSDGFLASKILFDENPELYRVLCETPLEFQYLDEGCYDFRSVGPTLLRHPGTGRLEQVRYNPRHVTTVTHIPPSRIPLFYEAWTRFTEILNENIIWVQLEPGTILWLNNWRILHGRNGFTGYRSLASAYFPRSDWLSRARVLGLHC